MKWKTSAIKKIVVLSKHSTDIATAMCQIQVEKSIKKKQSNSMERERDEHKKWKNEKKTWAMTHICNTGRTKT